MGAGHWRSGQQAQDFGDFFHVPALGLPTLSPAEYFALGAPQLTAVRLHVDMPASDGGWSHFYARETPCSGELAADRGQRVPLQLWRGGRGCPTSVAVRGNVCVGMFGQAQELAAIVARQPTPDVFVTRMERVMNPMPRDPHYLRLRAGMRYHPRLVALADRFMARHSLTRFAAVHLRRGDFRLVHKAEVATRAQVDATLAYVKTQAKVQRVFLASDGSDTADAFVRSLLAEEDVRAGS